MKLKKKSLASTVDTKYVFDLVSYDVCDLVVST